jgi:hypothetical protein|tara:strand:- start:1895 stop:2074 length:180 start_codon:yes stop_codon:yes gene_type:complete
MKIKVGITVNVDVKKWIDNYGTDRTAVRQDVKDYCSNVVTEQLESVGVLKHKELYPRQP